MRKPNFIEFRRKLKRWSPHKYRRQCKENEQIPPIKVRRKANFVANLKKLYVDSDIKLLEMERKWSFSCRDHLSLPRADYGFAPEHHHGQRAFNGFTNFQTAEWQIILFLGAIFCAGPRRRLSAMMILPIRRMAISATARLKRKKLVDVLIEMFLEKAELLLIITKKHQQPNDTFKSCQK